jgi:hypothetical protein
MALLPTWQSLALGPLAFHSTLEKIPWRLAAVMAVLSQAVFQGFEAYSEFGNPLSQHNIFRQRVLRS